MLNLILKKAFHLAESAHSTMNTQREGQTDRQRRIDGQINRQSARSNNGFHVTDHVDG